MIAQHTERPPALPVDYSPTYEPPTPDLRTYNNSAGIHVQAVRLTEANMRAVWEWADAKQFLDPAGDKPGGGLVVTGLTVFTPAGRRRANLGDWIICWPNGSFDRCDDATFRQFYAEVTP